MPAKRVRSFQRRNKVRNRATRSEPAGASTKLWSRASPGLTERNGCSRRKCRSAGCQPAASNAIRCAASPCHDTLSSGFGAAAGGMRRLGAPRFGRPSADETALPRLTQTWLGWRMAFPPLMSMAERPRSGAPMEKGWTERGPRKTVRTLTKGPARPGLCLCRRVMLQCRMDRALTVPAPGGPFRTGFPDHGRQMTMIA